MIKSLNDLEGKLGYTVEELKDVLQNLPRNYYQFTKKTVKPDGSIKSRPISPSKNTLKDVQNRLVSRLFSKFDFPIHVQGSVRGKSYVTNAQAHLGNMYKFQTDIVGFFSFVTNKAVYDSLIVNNFSQKVANLITKLTTLKGHLPQGTPTSSYIANIVGLGFDKEILKICNENNIIYTRYVDDLTFSSKNDFQDLTFLFIQIINRYGFRISHRKTVYKKGGLEITGCWTVDDVLKPTKKQLQKYNDPNTPKTSKIGIQHHFKRLKEYSK
jgi:RNA-directed DNA polymerase